MIINDNVGLSGVCIDFRGFKYTKYKPMGVDKYKEIKNEKILVERCYMIKAYEPFTNEYVTIFHSNWYITDIRDVNKRIEFSIEVYNEIIRLYLEGVKSISSLKELIDEKLKKYKE